MDESRAMLLLLLLLLLLSGVVHDGGGLMEGGRFVWWEEERGEKRVERCWRQNTDGQGRNAVAGAGVCQAPTALWLKIAVDEQLRRRRENTRWTNALSEGDRHARGGIELCTLELKKRLSPGYVNSSFGMHTQPAGNITREMLYCNCCLVEGKGGGKPFRASPSCIFSLSISASYQLISVVR